ncbi:UNVERIFIED_CONTAM: putative E3 ubiquitin-protein ligase XBAT35 [Sesamum latifolium]|uniref:E3 ubiquitin-protein ligase XBAT35 n=1 Tax=Sesamum latifolium TaxID=2727402 RepID=A0AAW2XS44_9LAMI
MGQQQSKDELLYQHVTYGDIEGIKALRREGAGLEWIDREGKTPLIAACMSLELYNIAKTLIELGANVNAYRPGRQGGTPLHHAAKRGLEQTVKLLLSHGANALVMNDDCQTPLDIARAKGYSNIVRAIEGHVCLFSGWLREFYGPGFLELLAPQLLSRKVWVVILPCGSRNLRKPFKLELAIYSGLQEGQPRTIVPLWKANLDEPNFNQPDPTAIISDVSRIPRRWRRRRAIKSSQEARQSKDITTLEVVRNMVLGYVYSSEWELSDGPGECGCACVHLYIRVSFYCLPGDYYLSFLLYFYFIFYVGGWGWGLIDEKLNSFVATLSYFVFKDFNFIVLEKQVMHQAFPFNNQVPTAPATAPPTSEDVELAMAINASLQPASHEAPPLGDSCTGSAADAPASSVNPTNSLSHKLIYSSEASTSHMPNGSNSEFQEAAPLSTPSAPPVANAAVDDGPIHYPSIDLSAIDFSSPTEPVITSSANEKKEDGTPSSCTICLDAPL